MNSADGSERAAADGERVVRRPRHLVARPVQRDRLFGPHQRRRVRHQDSRTGDGHGPADHVRRRVEREPGLFPQRQAPGLHVHTGGRHAGVHDRPRRTRPQAGHARAATTTRPPGRSNRRRSQPRSTGMFSSRGLGVALAIICRRRPRRPVRAATRRSRHAAARADRRSRRRRSRRRRRRHAPAQRVEDLQPAVAAVRGLGRRTARSTSSTATPRCGRRSSCSTAPTSTTRAARSCRATSTC